MRFVNKWVYTVQCTLYNVHCTFKTKMLINQEKGKEVVRNYRERDGTQRKGWNKG